MTDGPSDEDGAREEDGASEDADRDWDGAREDADREVDGASEDADRDVDGAREDADRDVDDDGEDGTDSEGGNRRPTGPGHGRAGPTAGETVDDETTDDAGAAEDDDTAVAAVDDAADADDADAGDSDADDVDDADSGEAETDVDAAPATDVPEDVRKYDKFTKIDGGTYDRANEFLRDRTYITAREWAIARLCADFRTETGVEMTKIGENLPELVPFMTDTYTPQAVNQARASFEDKVRKSGATFLYGAMCDFFTAEELDDVMYEATEVAKFLLEVEGVELTVDDELEAEDRISEVMREVREQSAALRHDEMSCPECGHEMTVDED